MLKDEIERKKRLKGFNRKKKNKNRIEKRKGKKGPNQASQL